MKYSIDTSVLIESWLRRYPQRIFPSVWVAFSKCIEDGNWVATEMVFREISRKDDELKDWLAIQSDMFIAVDNNVQMTVTSIVSRFPEIAKKTSTKTTADAFVIALAHNHNHTVVTEEQPTTRHGIPMICNHFGIRCINTIQMMEELNMTF